MTDIPDLDGGQPDLSFRENASAILPAVVGSLYARSRLATRSGSSASIAHCRKRLRYSMEFFENCYGKR